MNNLSAYSGSLTTAALVLAAIIVALLLFRMINRRVRGGVGARLGVSEYHEIDKSRRLVLVRRDDVEHLILIGGAQDVVVESNIESPLLSHAKPAHMPPPMPVAAKPANVQTLPIRPAPRPAVFSGNRPPLRPVDPLQRSPEPTLAALRPERP